MLQPKSEAIQSLRDYINSRGDDIFRAYVLIEWDEGAAQERFLNKIKSEKEIYEAIRATELFDEMESKVEKYRERYGY